MGSNPVDYPQKVEIRMPLYNYECKNCGRKFPAIQKISDSKFRKCLKCKKYALQRLIGKGISVIFKGPGFYCTDHPKK